MLDKHAPTKVIEKKENKITSKPSIKRGIKTSMKIRDKFYRHESTKKQAAKITKT